MPIKRKRNRAITIRLSEEEHNMLGAKVRASGLPMRACIVNALRNSCIPSEEEIEQMKTISVIMANDSIRLQYVMKELQEMNAKLAKKNAVAPEAEVLQDLIAEVAAYRKENEKLWLSIRSLIARQ